MARMESTSPRNSDRQQAATEQAFPPLENVTRPVLTTREAAHYLLRSEQTLRTWSCFEIGPLRPVRIGKRLGWPTADVRRLVGM